MNKFPHTVSPIIVGAQKDNDSVVLIVVDGESNKSGDDRYIFRMSPGMATDLFDQLGNPRSMG